MIILDYDDNGNESSPEYVLGAPQDEEKEEIPPRGGSEWEGSKGDGE